MPMQQGLAKFFVEFLCHPRDVGAVAPSSEALALRTVRSIDWTNVKTIVEFGPGTGAITQVILDNKPPDACLLAIEQNPRFVEILERRFPSLTVFHNSVSNVQQVCESQGLTEIDAVISGLPWSSFTDEQQTEYLEALLSVLRPGGQFATYAYISGLLLPSAHRFRSKLREYFREVRCSRIVWLNVPPAFVYHCSK